MEGVLEACDGVNFDKMLRQLALINYGKLNSLPYREQMQAFEYETEVVALSVIKVHHTDTAATQSAFPIESSSDPARVCRPVSVGGQHGARMHAGPSATHAARCAAGNAHTRWLSILAVSFALQVGRC